MKPREWAIKVIERLQAAGHQSLLAGGCVRDSLLKLQPKDYDVATSATPNEIQALFGLKKTISIGKSFGVITVIGPKSAGNIEVATFRRDGGYSDGRRPDSIEFTDAREDAQRRDFTINGMFFDPISEEVIDFVGGQADLKLKLIRSIGDPDKRIEEDRLRMLRGVRFAATYAFEIEARTMAAIRERAADIDAVSPERVGNEIRRMFRHQNRSIALELLIQSGLWEQVLPQDCSGSGDWQKQISILKHLDADFSTVIAAVFSGSNMELSAIQSAWRLTNEETSRAEWILKNEAALGDSHHLPWSVLQPILISPHAPSALALMQARLDSGIAGEELESAISVCREKLAMEKQLLNPPPLVDGQDLKNLGIQPGPQFKKILTEVRNRQLDGELADSDQVKAWIADMFK